MRTFLFLLFFLSATALCDAKVKVGCDLLFTEDYFPLLRGKKIGVVTNHTSVDSEMTWILDKLKDNSKRGGYTITALFAPEHGMKGAAYAGEKVGDARDASGIPIYSLHGKNTRPSAEMLKDVDLLVFDIQDIGSRGYTYLSTLCYVMEAAAKQKIPVVVLDRPNPINGTTIDGPMLEEKLRSIVGYINVPYCHGMTIGELARFFNGEYQVGCKLTVVPMEGWNRKMTFADTELAWIPTSPNIPEATTVYYAPATGFLGELTLVNIGIGYTLPFKLVGAPWIDAERFTEALNKQKAPGVHFESFHYRPFYGKFAHEECNGALIVVTDPKVYKPVTTQYMILGILKSLYPKKFKEAIEAAQGRREMFNKVNGTEEVYRIMTEVPHIVWPLKTLHQKEREQFLAVRLKYLMTEYED